MTGDSSEERFKAFLNTVTLTQARHDLTAGMTEIELRMLARQAVT
jgi:hypothetical protein